MSYPRSRLGSIVQNIFAFGLGVLATTIVMKNRAPEPAPAPVVVRETQPAPEPERDPASIPTPLQELLKPPKFEADLPETLVTDPEGGVEVRWVAVPGATRYVVAVRDAKGKKVLAKKSHPLVKYISGFPTSEEANIEYRLSIAAINEKNEIGHFSESRPLIVKRRTDVKPPEVKSIKVEN